MTDRKSLSTRLRLWLIRRLMPRGYQLARRTIMGVPPTAEVFLRQKNEARGG